jgi:hypothetical protein
VVLGFGDFFLGGYERASSAESSGKTKMDSIKLSIALMQIFK